MKWTVNTKKKEKTTLTEETQSFDIQIVLKELMSIMESKKCEDIVILDLEPVNSYLSLFVIGTVKTYTQALAVSKDIIKNMKKYKLVKGLTNRTENSPESGWLVIDLGAIFVHIMTPEMREHYNLDRLWGDAKKVELQ